MIRKAWPDEADALTGLMLSSSAYAGGYRAIIRAYPVTPAMIREGVTRAAIARDRIAGFYRLDMTARELDLMFVGDEMQGTGIGRLLFDDMAASARDAGIDRVRIVAHPPAAAFYRRMGAVEVGVQPPGAIANWSRPIMTFDTSARLNA